MLKDKFIDEFKQLNLSISADECNTIISIMFPVYGTETGHIGHVYDYNRLVRDQRIGQENKFERYFILSIGENRIPRKMVMNALQIFDVDELQKFINNAFAEYSDGDLLAEIEAFISVNAFPIRIKEIFLKALIPGIKYIKKPLPGEILILSNIEKAEHLIIKIMKEIGCNETFYIMSEAIDVAKIEDLDVISYILDIMLISYNRIRENHGFPQVVTEKQLNELGKKYIKKVGELDKQKNLLALDNSLPYSIIQFIDPAFYQEYLKDKFLESDLNKLLYLSYIFDWRVGTGRTICGDSEHEELSTIISNAELIQAIEKAVVTGMIRKLDESKAIKIATFYFLYQNRRDNKVVDKNDFDCKETLREWGYYT